MPRTMDVVWLVNLENRMKVGICFEYFLKWFIYISKSNIYIWDLNWDKYVYFTSLTSAIKIQSTDKIKSKSVYPWHIEALMYWSR